MMIAREQPVSLRISVTDRCELRCIYCMPANGVPLVPRGDVLSFEEIVRFVRAARDVWGVSKVHLTGGEPLARAGIIDLVAMLAAEGVGDLALTTNGQGLASCARHLKNAGLARVNVSLDTLDPGRYAALTRCGKVERTIGGIDAALGEGLGPVKINTLVLRGYNAREVPRLAAWAIGRGCEIRFLELMPIGPAAGAFKKLFVSKDEVLATLSRSFDLRRLESGDKCAGQRFEASDGFGASGTIGVIPSVSDPFCSNCRRLRLTATGSLIGCLRLGAGVKVAHLLRSGAGAARGRLAGFMADALAGKSPGEEFVTSTGMNRTGG
jgi:cyclic pyranopterin phosphate synthase